MRRPALIAMLAVALMAVIGLMGALMLVDEAHAQPYEGDYRIWGSSTPETGTLMLAIDEDARIVFPCATWSIWLSEPMAVTLTTPNGVLVDEVLPAGVHDYTDVYEPGAITVVWTIGADTITYRLTVASGAGSAIAIDEPPATVTIEKWVLEEQNRNLAIGCILCALVPSLFLIPYYKRKKNDEYYLAF